MIKDLLIEKIKEESKKHPSYEGMLRVSEISLCPVRAYYSYKGLQQEIDDDKVLILEIGSKLHEFLLQHYLDDILEGKEIEVIRSLKNHKIVGHLDGIAKINGERVVLEFKTVADKKYKNKKTTRDYLPQEHHLLQIGIYMRMTRIKKGKLIYLLKSSGEIVEIDVELDDELNKKIEKLVEAVVEFVNTIESGSKEVEEEAIYRIFSSFKNSKNNSWKCNYCGFKKHCEKVKSNFIERELNNV